MDVALDKMKASGFNVSKIVALSGTGQASIINPSIYLKASCTRTIEVIILVRFKRGFGVVQTALKRSKLPLTKTTTLTVRVNEA